MIIRTAIEKDISTIVQFQINLAKETESTDLDIGLVTLGVTAVIKDSDKGDYYVAEENGQIIGCLITSFEWSDWSNSRIVWIASLYIDKKFRGKGVFKKMYEHLQEIIRKDKTLKGIKLYVNKSNEAAINVYNKLGMELTDYDLYEWIK